MTQALHRAGRSHLPAPPPEGGRAWLGPGKRLSRKGSGCGRMVDHIDDYRDLGEVAETAGLDIRKWQPPGPVSLAYARSQALNRILIGPFGSGKTTTCLVSEALGAIRAPRCLDGVRRYRLLCLRDTYRQLYKTCIASWHQWFPPTFGTWTGGQDRPAEHKLLLRDDYGPIELEVQFAALPEGSIKDFFDGFEPTAIFMNAMPTMPEDVLTYGIGRVGRWPPQRMLPKGLTIDKHMAGDANKTDVDSWFYRFCVEEKNADTDVFDMPGGLDPAAENVPNLPGGVKYYVDQARANAHRQWWVNINVHNRWGASRSGQPVYPEYDDTVHCAREDFDADPALELCIGLDAGTRMGGRPAAVFFQVPAGPRVKVIDELYIGRAGPTRFFDALLDALDRPHLRACTKFRVWVDPSAFVGADSEGGEVTWVELGEKALDLPFLQPDSNELHAFRIPTVRYPLTQMIGPGDPMFLMSPRCRKLRGGFNSGYRFARKEDKGRVKEEPDPEKNEYSHPHDALQHGLTGYFGRSLLTDGMRTRRSRADDDGRARRSSPFGFDFNL